MEGQGARSIKNNKELAIELVDGFVVDATFYFVEPAHWCLFSLLLTRLSLCITRCQQASCSPRVFCPVYNTLRLFLGLKKKKKN